MPDQPERPLLPTLRNEAHDRRLREQLGILRDHAPAGLAAKIDDVLAGRRSLRGLAESDDMDAFMTPLVERGLRTWEELPEERRQELEAQGRAEYGDPGPRRAP